MRKKAVLAGAAIVAAFSASARANLLVDGDFETPVGTNNADVQITGAGAAPAPGATIPWYDIINYTAAGKTGDTAFISSDIPQYAASPASDRINSGKAVGSASASTGGNAAENGDQYAYAFTIGQTSGTIGGVAQLITGINAGDTYSGSAYFFDKDNGGAGADGDRLNGNPSSADSVRMIWEDGSGDILSTSVSTATLAGTATVGPEENEWVQLTTGNVTAPAGAAQVVFELADTRGSAGGVMFADNADLEDTTGQSIPEPSSVMLLAGSAAFVLRRKRAR